MSIWRRLLVLSSICLAPLAAQAQIIGTDADYAVIMDHESGEILWSKQGETPMIPASMTKMMTAYFVFDLIDQGEITLADQMTVSADAWRRGGFPSGTSTMGLRPNERPTVEELLHGVIIMSGNDACIVLAEGIAGSEDAFAQQMTDRAHELGLTSVNFVNSTGLEGEGHVVSAADLAELARLTIENYPQYYDWYDDPEYTWGEYTQANRNPLLGTMDGADGLKTGHLSASGYGLTGSAVRDGKRRIIVLNGMPSKQARAQEAERLMRMAFTAFETRTIETGDARLAELDVWMGERRTVGVQLAESVDVTAHKRAFAKGKTEVVHDRLIEAPIAAGDQIATLVVTIEGKDPIELPLVAAEDVSRLGFVGRAIEGLSRMLDGGA
ncbi:MAG: D-alanyl-D-alanine carboxypeptidase family protein [Pseudomonadota bacterium]|nr:D-alanyl-D-alanine carboxypeptidase family protein [Pseudomonadota bacterium]